MRLSAALSRVLLPGLMLLGLAACDSPRDEDAAPAAASRQAPEPQPPEPPRMFRSVLCGRLETTPTIGEGLEEVEVTIRLLGSRSTVGTTIRRASLGWLCLLDAREARSIHELPETTDVEGLTGIDWLEPRHAVVDPTEDPPQEGAMLVGHAVPPSWFWRLREWRQRWRAATPEERARLCSEIRAERLEPPRETALGYMQDWLERGDTQVDPQTPHPDRVLEDIARACVDPS